MRIEKLRDQHGAVSYRARPIVDGVKKTVRARTQKEVVRQVAVLRDSQLRRRIGVSDPLDRPSDIFYDDLCDRFLAQYPQSEQSKRTLAANLQRSRTQFGRSLLRELTAEDIQTWLATLALAPTTKRSTLKVMRQVLHRAVRWNRLEVNIASDVEMPKEPNYKKEPFISRAEVYAVAEAMRTPVHRALIIVASFTGLRPQEWLALQWGDIDVSTRTLRVNRTVQNGLVADGHAKTRSALRKVHLTGDVLEALKTLPTALHSTQLVFPGAQGGVIDYASWRRKAWRSALAAAEVSYRAPQGMRDTFATLGLGDGAPLEWISEQIGHKDINITRTHYARWLPDREYDILDHLNAARSEQTGLKADSTTQEAI